jgi:hypothetical protein
MNMYCFSESDPYENEFRRVVNVNRRVISKKERDFALDEAEIEETQMSKGEIRLRDRINKELLRKKLHLRLMLLSIRDNRTYHFDFVPPMGEWFKELEKTQRIAVRMIDEYIEHLN